MVKKHVWMELEPIAIPNLCLDIFVLCTCPSWTACSLRHLHVMSQSDHCSASVGRTIEPNVLQHMHTHTHADTASEMEKGFCFPGLQRNPQYSSMRLLCVPPEVETILNLGLEVG